MFKNKVWVDLTMLVNWSGQLTGIQRVEYNLAKRFAAKDNVAFCVFDKVTQKCSEFDFKHIEYKVSMLQIQNSAPQATVNQSIIPSSYRHIIKKTYLSAVKILPRKLTATAGRGYRALKKTTPQSIPAKEVVFRKGDTLLILSGDWSDNLFADWVKTTHASRGIKVVQIVYDMLPYVLPAYFVEGMSTQFSAYMERIFNVTDGILAISKSTKKDVESFIKEKRIKHMPIKVFRLGEDFVTIPDIKPNVKLTADNFILCVGTIEARKNHTLLYYAAREAIDKGLKIPPIVVVGKVGWLSGDFIYLVKKDKKVSKQFVFINNCTDQELAWLFKNCTYTIYPSYYEGWGLPIAESLYYGKYCLASGSSSMPEIAGNIIEYFSPNDPIDLLSKMVIYTKNPKILKNKESLIKKSYRLTSWDDTFVEVDKFVSSLINQTI
jgi:hypothetical protein